MFRQTMRDAALENRTMLAMLRQSYCPNRESWPFPLTTETAGADRLNGRNRSCGSTSEPVDPASHRSQDSFETIPYESLARLRASLDCLDEPHAASFLTLFIHLPMPFEGCLPTLIRRRHRALRLILTSDGGRLPGLVTIGDRAACSGALGWRQMIFARDRREALRDALLSLANNDRLVVFVPGAFRLHSSRGPDNP